MSTYVTYLCSTESVGRDDSYLPSPDLDPTGPSVPVPEHFLVAYMSLPRPALFSRRSSGAIQGLLDSHDTLQRRRFRITRTRVSQRMSRRVDSPLRGRRRRRQDRMLTVLTVLSDQRRRIFLMPTRASGVDVQVRSCVALFRLQRLHMVHRHLIRLMMMNELQSWCMSRRLALRDDAAPDVVEPGWDVSAFGPAILTCRMRPGFGGRPSWLLRAAASPMVVRVVQQRP